MPSLDLNESRESIKLIDQNISSFNIKSKSRMSGRDKNNTSFISNMDLDQDLELNDSLIRKYKSNEIPKSNSIRVQSTSDINNIINNNSQNEIPEINNDKSFLGKKINRDPCTQEIKILLEKHKMGNSKCEEVLLNDEMYSDDIKMVMKYAEEIHPFQGSAC